MLDVARRVFPHGSRGGGIRARPGCGKSVAEPRLDGSTRVPLPHSPALFDAARPRWFTRRRRDAASCRGTVPGTLSVSSVACQARRPLRLVVVGPRSNCPRAGWRCRLGRIDRSKPGAITVRSRAFRRQTSLFRQDTTGSLSLELFCIGPASASLGILAWLLSDFAFLLHMLLVPWPLEPEPS